MTNEAIDPASQLSEAAAIVRDAAAHLTNLQDRLTKSHEVRTYYYRLAVKRGDALRNLLRILNRAKSGITMGEVQNRIAECIGEIEHVLRSGSESPDDAETAQGESEPTPNLVGSPKWVWELQRQKDDLARQVKALKAIERSQAQRIEELETNSANLAAAIKNAWAEKAEVEELRYEITRLKQTNAQLQDRISNLTDQLARGGLPGIVAKNREIEGLQAQIHDLRTSRDDWQNKRSEEISLDYGAKVKQVEDLQNKLDTVLTSLDAARATVRLREADIEELQAKVREARTTTDKQFKQIADLTAELGRWETGLRVSRKTQELAAQVDRQRETIERGLVERGKLVWEIQDKDRQIRGLVDGIKHREQDRATGWAKYHALKEELAEIIGKQEKT